MAAVRRKLDDELKKVPAVTGGGANAGQVYMTQRLGRVMAARGEGSRQAPG